MSRYVPAHRMSARGWMLILFTAALLYGLTRSAVVQVSARLSGAVSGKTVVIDPGHGGLDPGAVGGTGLREKDLVLEIGQKLRQHLGRAGIFVIMTRDTDRDHGDDGSQSFLERKRQDLAYRVDLANQEKADVYLSLHANSIADSSLAGAQVFYNPRRQNARELAGSIQAAMVKYLAPNYRLAKPGDYRVLNDTEMPAVVVEIGFLSNPAEEALLASEEYKTLITEAVYQGLLHYFLSLQDRKDRIQPTLQPLAEMLR